MTRRWAPAAAVATALLWGTTGAAAALMPQQNPVSIGAASVGIGGLVLGLSSVRSIRRVLAAPKAPVTVALGALGLCLYMPLFYLSVVWAGIALGTVLSIGAGPVFAGLLEWAVDKHPVTRRWVLAAGATICGAVLLVTARVPQSGHVAQASLLGPGVLVALAAAAAYALYAFQIGRLVKPNASRPQGLAHKPAVAAVQAAACLPMLGLFAATGGIESLSNSAWPLLMYLGVVPTAVGHTLFSYALGGMRASSVTLITVLEPVMAAALAVAFFHESFAPAGWPGFVLVGLGIVLVSLPRKEPLRTPAQATQPAPSR